MSSRLNALRALRNEVVQPLSECGSTRWQGKSFKVRKPKSKKKAFKEWLSDVVEEVDAITGMDIDILPEMPWVEWFREGLDPRECAEEALRLAEEDDEDEDEDEEEDEDEDDLREALRVKQRYQRWLGRVDEALKKTGHVSLKAVKAAARVSNKALRDMFMNPTAAEQAARLLLQMGGLAAESKGSLRRRSFVLEQRKRSKGVDDVIDEGLRALMDGLGMTEQRPRPEVPPELAAYLGEDEPEEPDEPEGEDGPTGVAEALDDVRVAGLAVRASIAAEKGVQPPVVGEASVQGGDYGRWKPATAAAAATGPGLGAAIGKKEGEPYTFVSDGMAQSADAGSELWFGYECKKQSKPDYYLGFKIKGDKENPSWDVILKKGAGLGSATSVGSVRGVESSGLKAAVGKLKAKIKGGSESEE